MVYADFESILKQGVDTGTKASTHAYQEHIPCSFAYKILSSVDPNFSRPLVMYRGNLMYRLTKSGWKLPVVIHNHIVKHTCVKPVI